MSPNNYITKEMIGINSKTKLYFVDSPIGSGKSFLIKDLAKGKRTLVIVPNALSSKILANQIGSGFLSYSEDLTISESQIVIDIMSLRLLPDVTNVFEMIIFDDCVNTMNQLVKSKAHWLNKTIFLVKKLCTNSNQVFCLEHNITSEYIRYFKHICKVDEYVLKKFNMPLELVPVKIFLKTDGLKQILNHMAKNQAYIVFCNNYKKAVEIYSRLGIQAKNEILLITERTINGFEQQRFVTNPNTYAHLYNVIVTTQVLNFSISIDTHFTTAYDIIYDDVQSFRELMMFISRLRSKNRPEFNERYTWFEHEKVKQRCLCKMKDSELYNMAVSAQNEFQNTEMLSMYLEEYKKAGVSAEVVQSIELRDMESIPQKIQLSENRGVYKKKAPVYWTHQYAKRALKQQQELVKQWRLVSGGGIQQPDMSKLPTERHSIHAHSAFSTCKPQ